MEYQAYEKYRSPELSSIELIPEHWKEKKLRFLFTLGRGLGITKSDLLEKGIPCINYGEIHSKYGFEVIPEKHDLKCVVEQYLEESPSALLSNGDFVFADTSEDLEGAGNFSYLNSDIATFAGYHTVIARPTGEESSRFLAYFVDSSIYRSQIRKSVSGVKVLSITQNILKDSYVWLPPFEEQQKIVTFLDCKTQKIDQLTEKKKVLIEKLEEKRIAVITQAVTKGLDKNARLIPSGVDWLGDVPEHWAIIRLRFLSKKIEQGWSPLCNNYSADEDSWGVMKVGCVNGYSFDESDNKALPHEISPREEYEICSGDVLISRANTKELLGSAALVKEGVRSKLLLCDKLYRLKLESSMIDSEYLLYVLRSTTARFQYEREATGASGSMQNIGQDTIKNLFVAVPPLDEQREIADGVGKKLNQIDDLLSVNRRFLDGLEEYRRAVITNAVTGKIDVREVEISRKLHNGIGC